MYRNTHRAPSESTRPHIGPHHIAYFRVHSCARRDACQSCGRQVMCARRLQARARGTQAGEVPVAARLSGLIVLGPIRLVQTRDLRHQRIVCRIPTRRNVSGPLVRSPGGGRGGTGAQARMGSGRAAAPGGPRRTRVRIRQQRAHRQQHLGDRQRRAPLALQDVKANATVVVHVAVVDLRRELHLRARAGGAPRREHGVAGRSEEWAGGAGKHTFGGLKG